MLTLDSTKQSILDADAKKVSWLFTVPGYDHQNFDDYTEADPNSHITVCANRVDFASFTKTLVLDIFLQTLILLSR